jgi:hypothetical protein
VSDRALLCNDEKRSSLSRQKINYFCKNLVVQDQRFILTRLITNILGSLLGGGGVTMRVLGVGNCDIRVYENNISVSYKNE